MQEVRVRRERSLDGWEVEGERRGGRRVFRWDVRVREVDGGRLFMKFLM